MKMNFHAATLAVLLLASGCSPDEPLTNSSTGKPDKPEAEWVIHNISNSKLPDNQINALVIGKDDVKWAGTANGLVKISGEKWIIYDKSNSPLPSGMIRAVALEDNGTVWAGTDKGLAKFDGKVWKVYDHTNTVLTNDGISCITHDKIRKVTWIGTETELVKVDDNDHWKKIEIGDNLIISMVTDKDGKLWLGTFNQFAFIGSIKKYDNGNWTHQRLDHKGYPSTFPYALAIDKNNALLAVLSGTSVKSVVRISGEDWEEIPRPAKAHGLKTILTEGDKIWVGGLTLSVFGDKNAACLAIPESGSLITAMALDSKGRKWLGTIDAGLAVYNEKIK